MSEPLRLATRGSLLARAQSQQVADAITAASGRPVELVIISTRGDRVQDRPLAEVGGKGLFTKELEEALLEGSVDFAVHSMKDMPTEQPEGLGFAAVPERVDPRDVLVGSTLAALPQGAVLGTGSLRRARQIAAVRPDLDIRGIRGNVDTRINKQRAGEYDAIVLAAAGLARLGRSDDVSEALATDVVLPAVGQGALALQIRLDRQEVHAALAAIHHPPTAAAVDAERSFLATISGGCSVPAACFAEVVDGRLWVRGRYAPEVDGGIRHAEVRGALADAVSLGAEVARQVMQD